MKMRIVLVIALFIVLLASGVAQTYETGKIVSIAKHETPATPGHTDVPLKTSVDDYDVTISSGGTVYVSVYHHPGDLEPAWSVGKDVQVRVAGKVLYVKKASGKPEKLRIINSKAEGS